MDRQLPVQPDRPQTERAEGDESKSSTTSQPPGLSATATRPSVSCAPASMDEDQARMDEVEGTLGQRVGSYVVTQDLHVGPVESLKRGQEARVDVGGGHVARIADPVGEPTGDRAATRAEFQAAPAGANASRLQKRMVRGSYRAARLPKRCSVSRSAALSKM